MLYCNIHNSEVLSALEQAEQVARPLWTLIDDVSPVFPQYHISRTALNYGLNLLPDDVLLEIFVLAGKTLDEKVALSLVCKRFRRVMMSMRKMWDEYWIESDQTPEQIISIAEGNGFVSLKASIHPSFYMPSSVEDWVANRGLDLKEYRMRYFKFSVGLILSFELAELGISCWKELDWEAIEPILASGNMQSLRRLVMPNVSRISAGGLFLEKCHMPLLRNLEVGFVPGAALGRTLVQCNLGSSYGTIREVEIDALREFLAAAKSLQDLRLFLGSTVRFYEVCDLPSLRSLEVNFEPHPSLARHLVRLRLFLPSHRAVSLPSHRAASLSRLLDFLSSSEALQELVIRGGHGFSEYPDTIDALPVVTMPSVVSCEFSYGETGPTLIAKLRMPMLRTLELRPPRLGDLSTMLRNEFRTSLQFMTSLEDVELKGRLTMEDLDEIIRYAPPHLESFSLEGRCGLPCNRSTPEPPLPPGVPRWKLIRFMSCNGLFPESMPAFVDYLRAIDLGRIELQFTNCEKCRDGTFGLDDMMSAGVIT